MTWDTINGKKYAVKYRVNGDDAVLDSGKYSGWYVSNMAKDHKAKKYLEFIVDYADEELLEIIEMYI